MTEINPAAVGAPRHTLSGEVLANKVSGSVPLFGHFKLTLFSACTVQLEYSTDGGATWGLRGTFGGGLHRLYEPNDGVLYRLNGASLNHSTGFKLCDHDD